MMLDRILEGIANEVAKEIEGDLCLNEYGGIRASYAGMKYVGMFSAATEKVSISSRSCAKGCCCCCYYMVEAQATEIFLIAQTIHSLPPDDKERWIGVISEVAEKCSGLSHDERLNARIPCTFLHDDGSCLAYSVRPIACRAYESIDAESCRTGDAVPVNGLLHHFGRAFHRGIGKALTQCGFRDDWFELHAGLKVALETPNAEWRWLAGEDIFSNIVSSRRRAARPRGASTGGPKEFDRSVEGHVSVRDEIDDQAFYSGSFVA